MRIHIRQLATMLAALGLAAGAHLSARAFSTEGSFDRSLKVTGAVEMEVTTGSGNIDVRSGNSSTVHVHGTIRASDSWRDSSGDAERKVRFLESNPPIEQSGNVIRIGHIDDPELRRNISISYELEVPAETRLTSSTGSGHLNISGISGPLKANSGSGSLKISGIGGEAELETGSGDVEADSIKGRVRIRTGSGWIRGSGIAGAITAVTGSGDIRLEQTAPGDVRVETGSGGAEVSGVRGGLDARAGSGSITVSGEPTSEWRLHSGSGTLTVRLTSQVGFDLDAHTSSGHIDTVPPITVQGSFGRGHIQGKARGGGVRLELETGSGNIRIE